MYYMEQMPGVKLQGDIKTAKVFRVCHLKGNGLRKAPENITLIKENLTRAEANELKNYLNAKESNEPFNR